MEKIKAKEIYPGIMHIKFKSQYWETSTFMRLQEFYESPFKGIRDKYFTREQYQDKYVKAYGKFDYYTRWSGFNVPGDMVNKFFRIFREHNDLTRKEWKLYSTVSKITLKKNNSYYLIATHTNEDLEHEVAHGFYYLFPKYKNRIDLLIKQTGKSLMIKRLRRKLLKMGYANKFLKDEIQAYLSTNSYDGILIPEKGKGDYRIISKFRKIFKQYQTYYKKGN